MIRMVVTEAEPIRRLYTTAQVCEIIGITYRMADYWIRVGLLDSCRAARGSGTRRMWDDRDLADARLAALLMSVRHDTIWAGHVMEQVRALGTDWAGHRLVIYPRGDVAIDAPVETIAVVVNLGALIEPPAVSQPDAA